MIHNMFGGAFIETTTKWRTLVFGEDRRANRGSASPGFYNYAGKSAVGTHNNIRVKRHHALGPRYAVTTHLRVQLW